MATTPDKNGMVLGSSAEPACEVAAERLLERHLQDFLLANISEALGIRLRNAVRERPVEGVGRIDIFAEGPRRSVWAIELKIGQASREAVGQIASYLGGLRSEGIKANGVLIAGSFDKSAIAASKMIPSIYLMSYGIGFSFNAVGERRIVTEDYELALEPLEIGETKALRRDQKVRRRRG